MDANRDKSLLKEKHLYTLARTESAVSLLWLLIRASVQNSIRILRLSLWITWRVLNVTAFQASAPVLGGPPNTGKDILPLVMCLWGWWEQRKGVVRGEGSTKVDEEASKREKGLEGFWRVFLITLPLCRIAMRRALSYGSIYRHHVPAAKDCGARDPSLGKHARHTLGPCTFAKFLFWQSQIG